MPAPDDGAGLPLRILVKGGSAATTVAPMPGRRGELVFARWLESMLLTKGLSVDVRNSSTEGQTVREALDRWYEGEYAWSPDVVVINLGQYECVHVLLPHWFERLANNGRDFPSRPWRRYKRLVRRAWRWSARVQRRIDAWATASVLTRTGRTAAEINVLIHQVRHSADRLVLVLGWWHPTPPWDAWFPGMGKRVDNLEAAVEASIASRGSSSVRLVPLRQIMTTLPAEQACPDGMHFADGIHRAIASELAAEILQWVDDRSR
jgi:hypothetical protein